MQTQNKIMYKTILETTYEDDSLLIGQDVLTNIIDNSLKGESSKAYQQIGNDNFLVNQELLEMFITSIEVIKLILEIIEVKKSEKKLKEEIIAEVKKEVLDELKASGTREKSINIDSLIENTFDESIKIPD